MTCIIPVNGCSFMTATALSANYGTEKFNDWLTDLDKEFTNLKESQKLKIRGRELVEDKSIILKNIFRRQLVEPFSGARNFGHPFNSWI